MDSKQVIRDSAALRGQRKFREAIDLVSGQLSGFDPDLLMNAYHEMFLAAQEAGWTDEALRYACKVLEEQPGLPSAKAFVDQHGGCPTP